MADQTLEQLFLQITSCVPDIEAGIAQRLFDKCDMTEVGAERVAKEMTHALLVMFQFTMKFEEGLTAMSKLNPADPKAAVWARDLARKLLLQTDIPTERKT